MHKVTVHKKQQVNEEQPNPAAAHHISTTARHSDNTRLSAWCRADPPSGPPKLLGTEVSPRNEVTFLPFSRGFLALLTEGDYILSVLLNSRLR
jgi:hypothetical protein